MQPVCSATLSPSAARITLSQIYSKPNPYRVNLKNLIYIFLFLSLISCKTSQITLLNPTGTYKLGNHNPSRETEGYFGEIQVKRISESQIVMTFMINKGAPSYNSGSFIDTLEYNNNIATFKTPEYDPSCNIKFRFEKNGVSVNQESDNYRFGCGFGNAVVAKGYFRKVSSDIPILKHPMTDEEL